MLVAIAGWLALAAAYYLALPIFDALSLLGWLVLAVCWAWAVIGTVVAVVARARQRGSGQAAILAVVALAAGTTIWHTDWLSVYLRSQIWLHSGELSRLAADHDAGRISGDVRLPWRMRYLSIDGTAHRQINPKALSLPMWQDWRGESGGGIVHLPAAPTENDVVVTAPGGLGIPSRQVAGGWWWVQGG